MQRGLHGRRGDVERLEQESLDEQGEDERDDDEPGNVPRNLRTRFRGFFCASDAGSAASTELLSGAVFIR